MSAEWVVRAIWGAGVVHFGIVAANVPLPGQAAGAGAAGGRTAIRAANLLCALDLYRDRGRDVCCIVFWICAGAGGRIGAGTTFSAGSCAPSGCCGLCCRFFITTGKSGARTAGWICCIWDRWWYWWGCLGSGMEMIHSCPTTFLSPLRGLISLFATNPRLAPWAAFSRRFAARVRGGPFRYTHIRRCSGLPADAVRIARTHHSEVTL